MHEAEVYKDLAAVDGVPSLLWHGISGDYNAIVLDLLGPDLDELFDHCNRKFTDKTMQVWPECTFCSGANAQLWMHLSGYGGHYRIF